MIIYQKYTCKGWIYWTYENGATVSLSTEQFEQTWRRGMTTITVR